MLVGLIRRLEGGRVLFFGRVCGCNSLCEKGGRSTSLFGELTDVSGIG